MKNDTNYNQSSFNLNRDINLYKSNQSVNFKKIIDDLKLENNQLKKKIKYIVEQERNITILKIDNNNLKQIISKYNIDKINKENDNKVTLLNKSILSLNESNTKLINENNKLKKMIIKIINDITIIN